MKLTKKFVDEALANTLWDVGNQALYNLCRRNPSHNRNDVITAKIWLSGRAYSAAIERRPDTKGITGDRFYGDVVAPRLRQSQIDQWLGRVRSGPVNARTQEALRAHKSLTDLFEDITGLRKASLASKYLHFHVPSAFFIFDSRARAAIRALPESAPDADTPALAEGSCDREYASFYLRCLTLTTLIEVRTRKRLSPRELDKVLLATFEAI